MGCVSSKVVTRSRSFQEELSLSLQRRTNGLPSVEGLLANKNVGGDQFLALLCTANTLAAKHRAGNASREEDKLSSHPTDSEHEKKVTVAAMTETEEPTSPETINTWELMADLEQEDGEQEDGEQEREQEQHPQELAHSSSLKVGEGVSRSRSFRTVEDLDYMVTGNSSPLVLKESHGIPSKDYPPDSGEQAQVEDVGREQDNEEGEGSRRDGDAHQAPDGSDCSGIKAEPEPPDVDSMVFSRSSSSTREPTTAEGNDVAGARSFAELKGLRRRAMAKELKALKVPSFEFSRAGSLREWLGRGGEVFSPGSYVTPKFGSFGTEAAAAAAGAGGEDAGRDEEALFDPQLVADLEDAMERLTMEEEQILSQIVESLQGSHGEDAECCIDI